MRIVIMERKVKVKRCEAVAGLNTIATDQMLSMGRLYRHGHSDQADCSFLRKCLLTQFFNTPSAK